MASDKIWISEEVKVLFQRLQEKLGGSAPILNVYADKAHLDSASAALHTPTLYPELNVPAAYDGDWGEVARGIAHLLSSLDGVPELCVAGTEADDAIAMNINSELQIIASAREALQPLPQWTPGVPGKLLEMILDPAPDTLDARRHFRLVQLHRLVLDTHPDAQVALDEALQKLPDETKAAKATFDAICDEDLRTPAGKATASEKLLRALGFDTNNFYLRRCQHLPGVYDDRSLDYYPALETLRSEFEAVRLSPGTWLKFQLPFALPVLEGIYKGEDVIAFVRHVRVINTRASWQASQGARIDSMMNPSGLYTQSVVELWLPGELEAEANHPPGDVQYKNIESYPEILRVGTIRLNELITGLRAETGRSDIPEVLPSDFNQIAYKQFDSAGSITRNILMASFEFLRISTGAPALKEEVRLGIHDVQPVGLARALLESAKFYVTAYNTRRAVLDLAGAFEAFVSEAVTPHIGDVALNTRDKFLRKYGAKMSAEACAEIKQITPHDDLPQMPSVHWQLKEYKRQSVLPALNKRNLERVQKIMSFRNDAAHGRPVPPEVLNDLIVAIEGLDCLIRIHATGS